MRALPGIGLTAFFGLGFDGWDDEMDGNLRLISALCQSRALNLVAALPGSPADGDIYLFDASAGADANKVAIRDNGAWVKVAPQTGWRFFDVALGGNRRYDGANWIADVDNDTTLAGDSAVRAASQHAVKTYVDNAVVGLMDPKGTTDCSGNPNYPAALKGDAYLVSVAGKIGGAAGTSVDIGDLYFATSDNAGGTQAAVGASWASLEHNGVFGGGGGLAAANNLSDLASAATARTNLGLLRPISFFFTTTPSAAEVLAIYPAAEAFTIPANLAGTQAKKIAAGANPAATFAVDIQQNGVSIATISISTGGVVTLSTSGGTAKAIAVGDIISFHAPGSADAAITNWSFNVKGTL